MGFNAVLKKFCVFGISADGFQLLKKIWVFGIVGDSVAFFIGWNHCRWFAVTGINAVWNFRGFRWYNILYKYVSLMGFFPVLKKFWVFGITGISSAFGIIADDLQLLELLPMAYIFVGICWLGFGFWGLGFLRLLELLPMVSSYWKNFECLEFLPMVSSYWN